MRMDGQRYRDVIAEIDADYFPNLPMQEWPHVTLGGGNGHFLCVGFVSVQPVDEFTISTADARPVSFQRVV